MKGADVGVEDPDVKVPRRVTSALGWPDPRRSDVAEGKSEHPLMPDRRRKAVARVGREARRGYFCSGHPDRGLFAGERCPVCAAELAAWRDRRRKRRKHRAVVVDVESVSL